MPVRVGVLALQGSFKEHSDSLRRLGVETVLVRLPEQLEEVDGLIIPGGESTTIGKIMFRYGFLGRIKELAGSGFPIYGTCAGMILLAKEIAGMHQLSIGVMSIVVKRNAYGRQLESFEEYFPVPELGDEPFRGIFIRAPLIEQIGEGVRPLARLENGNVVAAEEKNLLVSSFHPELTGDLRMHDYFLRKFLCFSY